MDIKALKDRMMEKLKSAPQIGAKIKFELDDLVLWVDGTSSVPVVHLGDVDDADTTFICNQSVLEGIVNGTQDPTMAYMMGKLKIQGSMGYALKLNSFLSD